LTELDLKDILKKHYKKQIYEETKKVLTCEHIRHLSCAEPPNEKDEENITKRCSEKEVEEKVQTHFTTVYQSYTLQIQKTKKEIHRVDTS